MKIPIIPIMVGACVAGLPLGFAARRISQQPSTPASHDAFAGTAQASSGNPTSQPGAPAKTTVANFPHLRSTETVESLLAGDGRGLYGRLAAWMADASESDIAAYWNGYKQKGKRSNDITDLVFLNWTRLDPQAAIAANAGSKDEHYAWWAWACHDPKNALAAAIATNPDRVNNVTWGIGEFHPEWLREHFKELPESGQGNAIAGMMKWDDGQNPLESLKFMKEIGYGANTGTLKALVRQDPWAALDWVRQNSNDANAYNGVHDPMQLVVKTMAEERPEELERLVAQTPSGQLKLKMESALFDKLLKIDPVAALEQAKSTSVPRVAAERLAAIGLDTVRENPGQAFELAKTLFATCPDALQMMAMVDYPGGSSGSGMEIPGVNEFVEILSSKDPAKVLEMTASLVSDRPGNSAFQSVASQWAERDVVSYSTWVNQQTDQNIRDLGSNIVANQLMEDGNFAEAIEWRMNTKSGSENVDYLLAQWKQSNADEAYGWLDAADLPAERKARLREQMEKQQ